MKEKKVQTISIEQTLFLSELLVPSFPVVAPLVFPSLLTDDDGPGLLAFSSLLTEPFFCPFLSEDDDGPDLTLDAAALF